ncbi:MAG: HlyD family efflux transporter periplasmic adaptor subunit [Sphingobacteriales bacterium]|nr:MAG: HlyD family efflux transporter periplasmic adaptor subunit [Sphingobacteriales bacterium]
MLEIRKTVEQYAPKSSFRSFTDVYKVNTSGAVRYWLVGVLVALLLILMLPWTQNIRARGSVTTLRQEERPQELNTIIAGRIIKWHVKEGDFVKAGDTIAQLAEVKDSYLDPQLLARTQQQMDAKTMSIESYSQKVAATTAQISAIEQAKTLKLEQLRNKVGQLALKVVSDSMEMIAAENDFRIAEDQYRRQRIMRDSGLASMVQVEQRNQSYQSSMAKKVSAQIKFTNTKTDLTNTRIELSQVEQEYAEKAFKAQSERASAKSDIASGEGELAKLTNQYANYAIRAGQYYLLAPQDGQIVKATKAGINEMVKEGEKLVEIVPVQATHAVELYVRPLDLPLVSRGQTVRFMFDGFPAIVFSGWPQASYGTFSGRIVAVENTVSSNGKFRVLVGEDADDRPWPPALKMGTGASGIALLKDVPIWYELWRNINGFPPDYYKQNEDDAKQKK